MLQQLQQLVMALDPWSAIVVLTLVNTLTGMLGYLLGWLCRIEWLERWLKVDMAKVEQVRAKVQRFGPPAALLAWLPGVGTPIGVSLGLLHCPPVPTAIFMALGKLARNAVAILALGATLGFVD